MKRLRRYLIGGLLIWLPLAVTVAVIRFMVRFMDRSLVLIPPPYRPENLLGFQIPGLGVVLTFVVLLVSGAVVANYFGNEVLKGWERLLSRIPLIRTVYSSVKQVAETVFSDSGQGFKKVLLIEYPRRGVFSLCFQTSRHTGEVSGVVEEDLICVFVPTTPNPTSGFIIFLPRADVRELSMSVDEALKMVMSLGVVVPSWKGDGAEEAVAKIQANP